MKGKGGRSWPVDQYSQVRESIRDGDLLLFKGKGLLSWIITKVSCSEYSHSGIAMWWEVPGCKPRLMVFEAIGKGICCNPASLSVDKYSGHVDWRPLTQDSRDKIDMCKLFTSCVDNLGKKFGVWGGFKYCFRRILGLIGEDEEDPRPKAMFCSWYVSYCLRQSGSDPVGKIPDKWTTPGDLDKSDMFGEGVTLR